MQTQDRIDYTRRQVEHYHSDVTEWNHRADSAAIDEYVWEQLIARANEIYRTIVELDDAILLRVRRGETDLSPIIEVVIPELLHRWLGTWPQFEPHLHQSIVGSVELLSNFREARASLTPDDEYFTGPGLERLLEAALAQDRAGETEPMPL